MDPRGIPQRGEWSLPASEIPRGIRSHQTSPRRPLRNAMIAETQRRYGSSYREDVRLPDGTLLTVRALGPDDATLLQLHFEHLSFESRHLRFLGGKSALTESELRFYTHPDGEMHVALIAVRADSPQKAVGVARFVRSKDTPQVAEPACEAELRKICATAAASQR